MKAYMERINFLKDRVINTRPEMDLENARILTASYRETSGECAAMQKAKAFFRQCAEKTVKIWPRELIVGCSGSKMRGGILCADTCWSILDEELETISTRRYDPFYLSSSDRETFLSEIKPFWQGRSSLEAWLKQIPDDTRVLRDNGVIYINRKAVRGWGETTAGYTQVINEGLKAIINNIEERREKLDTTKPGDYEKDVYLKAMKLSAEGIILLASRYADEAERLAAIEQDAAREQELLDIAAACRQVPRYPARSFREALQSLYLYQISIFMEQNAASYNPGRVDQYLYPYYKADIAAGKISEDEAMELLDCLWVKFSEPCLFQDAVTAEFAAGYPMFQNVCCGGVNLSGADAVNDLSYLILQATMDVQLYQPSLSVRYSMAKNPNRFLRKVVDLISLGTGFPAFHNDEGGIRMLMNKGIPLKEAFDWNPCGCVETNLEGRLRHYTALADINLGSMVEFVMTNGVCRKTGVEASIKTGENFSEYGQFKDALKAQLRYAIKAIVKGSHVIDEICMDRFVPALSLSFRECIENCLDYSRGGAKYNTGNGVILIGVADIINSLSAVKELVYDKKLVSMGDLKNALSKDFVGYKEIQKLCKSATKHGNDDEQTNSIAGEILSFIADEIESYHSKFGKMTPGILPVSGNTPFGLAVGALPSGRNAYKPLADGISPSGGTDISGAGAVLKSAASVPHERFVQGTLLNLKLEPDMLHSENGATQLMALLKSMCSLGVFHAQFNVIDQETLIKAQKNPENYKGLLIRVAGYTAYFTELGKDVQDEIIGRTVHRSIKAS